MRSIRRGSDEGATLLLALIFMAVFALMLGALLPAIAGGLINSTVVRAFDARAYVADSGIDYGIQQLRWDSSFCGSVAASPQSVTMPSTDARVGTATVTCNAVSGSSDILGGYAVVTTSNSLPSVTTQNGGNKFIDGPVWTTGLPTDSNARLEVKGNVQQATTACSAIQSGVTIDPPFSCTNVPNTPPNVGITVPSAATIATNLQSAGTPVGGVVPAALDLGSCRVFKPGIYTAPMDFGNNDNYLASGVYYLKNVALNINQSVIAGAITPGDPGYLNTDGAGNQPDTACSSDAAVNDGGNGQGVVFVLDGTSTISVSGGLLEAFGRANSQGWEGLDGLTVVTESTWTGSSAALSIGSGSGKELIIHGSVYTPNAAVLLGATSAPAADVLGGVYALSLTLDHANNVSNGTLISTHTGQSFRRVLLTSTVLGANGGRRVEATAIVDVENDPPTNNSAGNTVVVESRRNGGFSATS
jgi:hypothetical protein